MRSSGERGSQQLQRVLIRALRLRCPSCGRSSAFGSWFDMRRRCPSCNFWFERGDGYFIGALALNIVIGELVPLAFFFVLFAATWPHTPWVIAWTATIALAVLVPLALYHHVRMLWLALDLVIRPIHPQEYEREHALD